MIIYKIMINPIIIIIAIIVDIIMIVKILKYKIICLPNETKMRVSRSHNQSGDLDEEKNLSD